MFFGEEDYATSVGLLAARCCAAPVCTPARFLAASHLKAGEMIVGVEFLTRGTYQTVSCPIKLSDLPVQLNRPPLLGEHTNALLSALR